MEAVEIKQMQNFLSNFSRLEKSVLSLKVERDISVFNSFLRSFGQVHSIAERLVETIAPKFNLFDIIQISSYEAWVHTPLLGNLFSPIGSHRQGRLFFDELMLHLFGERYLPANVTAIEVYEEHHTSYGNIDILIKYLDNGALKAIVIENKVGAPDQPKQLERYYNYLTRTMLLTDSSFLIAYLKPQKGKPSIPYSISQELYSELIHKRLLLEIDYNVDMTLIFEKTLPKVKAPVVRETVAQYIHTIKSL